MSKHIETPQDVVIQSWFTEKTTTAEQDKGRYAFKVDPRANKFQIKSAIETLFKVKVNSVNVMRVPGKLRRVRYRAGSTSSWKKAIVRLKPGFTIEF